MKNVVVVAAAAAAAAAAVVVAVVVVVVDVVDVVIVVVVVVVAAAVAVVVARTYTYPRAHVVDDFPLDVHYEKCVPRALTLTISICKKRVVIFRLPPSSDMHAPH